MLQVMTADDIHSLRAAGANGDDIVSALVANSATFDAKTAFSQEKYRAKKKRIHCPRITAYKPTSARVCAAFFSKVCVPCSPIREPTSSDYLCLLNASSHRNESLACASTHSHSH